MARKTARKASTYRAARRNRARADGVIWPGVKARYFPPPPVRPNCRDRMRDLPADLRQELGLS